MSSQETEAHYFCDGRDMTDTVLLHWPDEKRREESVPMNSGISSLNQDYTGEEGEDSQTTCWDTMNVLAYGCQSPRRAS
jgi:hypothetical protein